MHTSVMDVAVCCSLPAGVGDGSDGPDRVFTHYPKITAFSSMYPDPEDAADAVYSLILMRPFNFTAPVRQCNVACLVGSALCFGGSCD